MTISYRFVAKSKKGSINGSITFESESGLYSVKEDKFTYPDGCFNTKCSTLFPFRSLDEVVNCYLSVGFTIKLF